MFYQVVEFKNDKNGYIINDVVNGLRFQNSLIHTDDESSLIAVRVDDYELLEEDMRKFGLDYFILGNKEFLKIIDGKTNGSHIFNVKNITTKNCKYDVEFLNDMELLSDFIRCEKTIIKSIEIEYFNGNMKIYDGGVFWCDCDVIINVFKE